jgi:hypothetical protein
LQSHNILIKNVDELIEETKTYIGEKHRFNPTISSEIRFDEKNNKLPNISMTENENAPIKLSIGAMTLFYLK